MGAGETVAGSSFQSSWRNYDSAIRSDRVKEMPRSARKISGTNIYHVMLRGINRQDIFEEEEDFLRFLAVLKECKEISGFE